MGILLVTLKKEKMAGNTEERKIVEIAGINFTCIFHKKYEQELLTDSEIKTISAPMIKIEDTLLENTYRVTIGAYLPKELDELVKLESCFPILENFVCIKYNGIGMINTSISTTNTNESVLCRNFDLIYKNTEPVGSGKYNLNVIVFEYTFISPSALNAEAIMVRDVNIDPVTSRGTVCTPANPDS